MEKPAVADVAANVAQAPVQNDAIKPLEVKKEFREEITQNIITPQVAPRMAEEKN